MNRKKNLSCSFTYGFLMLLVICLALTGGCGRTTTAASANGSNAAGSEAITVSGNVEVKEISLASKVPGRIEEVSVEEGDVVVAGQELLKLESIDLEAKRTQAEGALLAAQAQYEKAQNGARPEEIELARATVQQAQAKVSLLETTYAGLENLHKAGAYTTNDLDKARTELEVARSQLNQAKQQLALTLKGVREEDIKAAEANCIRAEGALEEIDSLLSDTVLKAPQAGTVTLVARHKGELVSTGMPLVNISDYSDMWVIVNVTDKIVSRIKVGQEARIQGNGLASPGKVLNINKNPDFAVKKSTNEMVEQDTLTYTVKVKIMEPENFLPGLRVEVTF